MGERVRRLHRAALILLIGLGAALVAGIIVFYLTSTPEFATWKAETLSESEVDGTNALIRAIREELVDQDPIDLALWISGFIAAIAIGAAGRALQRQPTTTVPLPPQLPTSMPTNIPAGVHNLPPQSEVFVGRDLEQLRQALAGDVTAIGQAIHGLGGVGKTELALHYAHANAEYYSLRWWITADTADSITRGLAELAQDLHPELVAKLPLPEARKLALTYLQTHADWLLILDNVDEFDDIAELLGQLRGKGHVLITTRRDLGHAEWRRQGLTTIRLDILPSSDSLQMLEQLLGPKFNPGPARRLADQLGHLPLALQQAAAYISQDQTLEIDAFVDLLTEQPAEMLGRTVGTGPEDRAVARVWTLTTQTITKRNPLARRILDILAYVAPDHLPEIVFAPLADELPRREALTLLASYSMITRSGGGISVHRLVQAITREHVSAPVMMSRRPRWRWSRRGRELAESVAPGHVPEPLAVALELLAEAAPPAPVTNVDGWPMWRALLAHIDAAARHLPSQHRSTLALSLLDRMATFQLVQGQLLDKVIPLYETVLADRKRVLGPDHPSTLASHNNLAYAYLLAGQLAKAIPQFESTLADRQRVLGPYHPDTLTTLDNLAQAYLSTGRADQAIPRFQANLADRLRVLGPDHPDTLTSRNNLAFAYLSAGLVDQAIRQFEANLSDTRQVLGPDHPDTLSSRNNLALAHLLTGQIGTAILEFEATLADRQRVLGPDHPYTLTSRNNLAHAYLLAGRLDDTIELHEAVLSDRVRVLGPDHPDTLTSRSNLAHAYLVTGQMEEAIRLHEATLADRVRVLGPDHPDTLTSRNNLAHAYLTAGQPEEAIQRFESIISDTQRILGMWHPLTLTTERNLEEARRSQRVHQSRGPGGG